MSGAADGDSRLAAGGCLARRADHVRRCRARTRRHVPEHLFHIDTASEPTPVGLLWRARSERNTLNNVRKTLIVAAIAGTLVTLPSGSAYADPMGFDPNVPPAGPAPDAPPPPAPDAPPAAPVGFAPDAPPPPAPDAPPPPAPDAPPPPGPDAPAPDAPPPAPIRAYSVNWDAIAQCESGGNWGISTGKVTPAACSSPRAHGAPTAAPVPRAAPAARSRSEWPRTCCTRRASAPGRSAVVGADARPRLTATRSQ